MKKKYGGNLRRRHGNMWYAGKYLARTAGGALGAVGGYFGQGTNFKWGWKRGGRLFKRVGGGIKGPRARLGVNRRPYSARTNGRVGSNPGHRLGSNPSKRPSSNAKRRFLPFRKVFKAHVNKIRY